MTAPYADPLSNFIETLKFGGQFKQNAEQIATQKRNADTARMSAVGNLIDLFPKSGVDMSEEGRDAFATLLAPVVGVDQATLRGTLKGRSISTAASNDRVNVAKADAIEPAWKMAGEEIKKLPPGMARDL